VAAVAGIGNPGGFRHTLAQLGCQVIAERVYPDHFPYAPDDIAALEQWLAEQPPLDAVVCTGKDLVKIGASQLGPLPLWALAIQLHVSQGLEQLASCLAPIAEWAAQPAPTRLR
jgi:tetraacyldisaccharide 4'-kinase